MRSHALLGLTAAAVFATAAFAQETPATPPAEPTPAPAAEAPAPAPPPPPPAPTDVTSLAVLDTLTRVCAESVRGGNMAQLAPAAGFKKKKDVWVKTYTKGYTMTLLPPGTNPQVCNLIVDHPVNGVTPVIIDLHNWAMGRQWELYRNDKFVTDMERTTRSWELRTATETEAVVLMTVRKANGAPLSSRADRTELLYSLYKTPAQ
jgi:hypothetical protein